MPHKDLHDEPFDEGTITKLEIFEDYFKEWIPVFLKTKWIDTIQIYDFFAGTGEDKNGCPGSPLRILNVLNKFQPVIETSNSKIKIVLNEYDKSKFEKVQTCVKIKEIIERYKVLTFNFYKQEIITLFYQNHLNFKNL